MKKKTADVHARITEHHLDALFRQVPDAKKSRALVFELSRYHARAQLDLILCPDVPATVAAAERMRDQIGGRFELEYNRNQFFGGAFSLDVLDEIRLPETTATLQAFAAKHGFLSTAVLPLYPEFERDGNIFHFWASKMRLTTKGKGSALAELEDAWTKLAVLALADWSKDNDQRISNVILYFGGDDPGRLELLYVNGKLGETASEAVKGNQLAATTLGAECALGSEMSFHSSPVSTEKAAIRFAHRLAARLEVDKDLSSFRKQGAWFMPLFHDRESRADMRLFDEARARLDESVDTFVRGKKS